MLLAAGLFTGAMLLLFDEPYYDGRRLSTWIELYDNGGSPTEAHYERPVRAIRYIGTNSLPFLLKWLDYEPTVRRSDVGEFPENFHEWIGETCPGPWLLLGQQAGERAYNAMEAFAVLGPLARPAIPELIRRINLTNSPFKRDFAMFALTSLGADAVPALSATQGVASRHP